MFIDVCLTRSLKLVDVGDVTIVTSSVAVARVCCGPYKRTVTAFHHFLVDCRQCFTSMDIYWSMLVLNVDA